MSKKLLFISLSISIFIVFNNLLAETTNIIPLKKPILTTEEIDKKLSKNILIPIQKPKKTKKIITK
jgi:soluble lytic murein transglycosylase